jgi:hypothetical protein
MNCLDLVLRIRDVLSRIQDRDPTIFSSRILIQTFFHPGPRILHEKCNANLLFLASYAFRRKVLDLVIVKKIRDPDPGGKITPDPGSATLLGLYRY